MLRVPAITPDTRHHYEIQTSSRNNTRTVSFTALQQMPGPVTAAASAAAKNGGTNNDISSKANNEAILRQYSLYRSAPDQFPSYERLRFVRLPRDWLPADLSRDGDEGELLRAGQHSDNGLSGGNGTTLRYWPALVYQNLAELVRDLSPTESKMLKAKLILEHRKCPNTVVARLLGWNTASDAMGSNSGGSSLGGGVKLTKSNMDGHHNPSLSNPFEETKLELIRLTGSSLEENELHHGEQLISFVDSQLGFDHVCDELLARHSGGTGITENNGGGVGVVRYVLRFRKAVDMALNCLALDMGDDPLPMRNDEAVVMLATPNNRATNGPTSTERKSSLKTPSNTAGKKSKTSKHTLETKGTMTKKVTINGGNHARDNNGKRQEKSDRRQPLGDAKAVLNRKENQQSSSITSTVTTNKNSKKNAPLRSSGANRMANKGTIRSRPESSKTRMTVPKKQHDQPAAKTAKPKTSAKPASKFTSNDSSSSSESSSLETDISWKDLWAHMRKCGWSWKGGSGLMMDYYYVKPGCNIKGGTAGHDYFVTQEDTQKYARRAYKWESVARAEVWGRIEGHAKYSGEVVPPLTEAIDRKDEWKEAWAKMQRSGWTWKVGSGLTVDYCYAKPGCKIKGGIEDKDYFVGEEGVQNFAKRNYGWRGEGGEMESNAAVSGCDRRNDNDKKLEKRRSSGEAFSRGRESLVRENRRRGEKAAGLEPAALEKPWDECKPAAKRSGGPGAPIDVDEKELDDERSTFSEDSGFRTKKLFLEECADNIVPALECDIIRDEPWRDVWVKMRQRGGWTWKIGSGLMTDYYYIKPGCAVKGGMEGQDYFVKEEDVKRFVMRNYGWRGCSGSSAAGRKRSSSARKKSNRNKRQRVNKGTPSKSDSGMLRASTKTKSHKSSPSPPRDRYERKPWQALQKDGWRAVSAGKYNKLHDWYYVRPNCNPGDGQLGVDYFLSEEDAIVYYFKHSGKKMSEHGDKIVAHNKSKGRRLSRAKVPSKTKGSQGADHDGLQTPADCRTKPQDPAIPLLPSPDKSFRSPRSTSSDLYEWNTLWQMLQRVGWMCVKAGKYNPLHDWYYVRPGRNPGDASSQLGRHYFTCESDVIDFVKRLDKENTSGKKSRKSMGIMLCAFEEEA